MGSYLNFDNKENNSKSTSCMLADLIRVVSKHDKDDKLCRVESNGWSFNKRGVARLIANVEVLLKERNNYEFLDLFMERTKEEYYGNQTKEEYIEDLEWIYKCLVNSLTDMVWFKKKRIYARWV